MILPKPIYTWRFVEGFVVLDKAIKSTKWRFYSGIGDNLGSRYESVGTYSRELPYKQIAEPRRGRPRSSSGWIYFFIIYYPTHINLRGLYTLTNDHLDPQTLCGSGVWPPLDGKCNSCQNMEGSLPAGQHQHHLLARCLLGW